MDVRCSAASREPQSSPSEEGETPPCLAISSRRPSFGLREEIAKQGGVSPSSEGED
ncbi:hypothetical protein [Pseudenhygromyxa sp. WMMC2535]|uniref:hypothetical protein n=1 Tax=Pseudenhygromyxa sp. WMMC2535 TaxID=2712867 RepID=UPI001C3DC7E4|nr:hypothetical protein [Pseudenhygromyxa sp. WMMC2535]